MSTPDLNLLVTLDVLLAEGSVARAAQRLRLSPSAMSRALARLRETTGDPLLVRAGRGLVPTPRALALRERVGRLVQDGNAVLRPAEELDLSRLVRTFTLRTSEGFVESFGGGLIARVGRQAPGVRLRFVQKPDKDSTPLRDGRVDLDQSLIRRGQAFLIDLQVQVATHFRILTRTHEKTMRQGFEIQPGTTADHDIFAALLHLLDALGRQPAIKCRVKFVVRIHDVDQMMAHALSIAPRRLACTDVHVAVDLL